MEAEAAPEPHELRARLLRLRDELRLPLERLRGGEEGGGGGFERGRFWDALVGSGAGAGQDAAASSGGTDELSCFQAGLSRPELPSPAEGEPLWSSPGGPAQAAPSGLGLQDGATDAACRPPERILGWGLLMGKGGSRTSIQSCLPGSHKTEPGLLQTPLAFRGDAGGFSQECDVLSDGVLTVALAAASVYYWLPKSQGTTLRKAVRGATVEVLEGLIQLTDMILRTQLQSLSPEQLMATGGVWDACDRVSCLPRDNQAAVVLAVASCLGVVKDALEEMEQAQVEGGDPYGDVLEDEDLGSRGNRDVYWSEADQQVLGPCRGLVKAAKACLKKVLGAVKTHGSTNTAELAAQLDDLADIAADISPSVDELVLSTYPPVNQLTLRLNAAKLASVLKKLLEVARASHICPPSEESWVQFLAGAVDHNMDKIKGYTQGLL